MSRATPKIIWPIYVFFIFAVATLLLALLLFYRANEMGRNGDQQLRVAQSQQVMTEQLFAAASDPTRAEEAAGLVDKFDAMQQLNPVADVDTAWADFRQSLPFIGDDAERPAIPDFAPLREKTLNLRAWTATNDVVPAQRDAANHLLQLVEVMQEKTQDDAGSAANARGAWLFFDQVLGNLEYELEIGDLQGDEVTTLLAQLRTEVQELQTWFALASEVEVPQRVVTDEQARTQAVLKIALDNQVAKAQSAKDRQAFLFQSALVAALASLVLFFLVSLLLWRLSRQWAGFTEVKEQRNQEDILKLLDEISALAEGDLTTHATVSDGVTGAIADSINYATAELRRLVAQITNSADRVTVAVEETGSSAQQLANASSVQSREIQRSTTYLSAMAETMEEMSQRSQEAAQIATQTVEKSVGGRQSVEKTVDGMNRIRAHVQQTSNLMKRLGESSEQIGEIVALINEVTSRSKLLALNSAIHSNSKSDENLRFTNIANDVQTLSATLKESARDIETLVDIIQDDTRAAVDSMNLTIAEVMQGNELATEAGDALEEIETISRRLSVVVEHLSQKTRKQSDVVKQLSANMGVINDVTRRSAHGMQLSASALEDLKHMAGELRSGVSGFVLPPTTGAGSASPPPQTQRVKKSTQQATKPDQGKAKPTQQGKSKSAQSEAKPPQNTPKSVARPPAETVKPAREAAARIAMNPKSVSTADG